jgi:phage-related protein
MSDVSVGNLYATLKLDKGQFERGLHEGGLSFGGFARAALATGAVVGAALLSLGIGTATLAADEERATERANQALGRNAATFEAWAAKNSDALRVSNAALLDYGSVAVSAFESAGIAADKSLSMTQGLLQRAADISAVTGKSFDEVYGALLKGAEGATKGLKGLGIVVDANAIKQEAETLGLYKGKGALDAAAKSQAIYALVMKDSASAEGDAQKRGQTMQEQLKELPVILENTGAALGQAFLPLVVAILPSVTGAFQGLATWITSNMPAIRSVVSGVGAAIGTAFKLAASVVSVAIGIIGGAIATLRPALAAVAGFIGELVGLFTDATDGSKTFGDDMREMTAAGDPLAAVILTVGSVLGTLSAVFGVIASAVGSFLSDGSNVRDLLMALGIIVASVVVPPFIAWAAATVIALAPIIALGVAVFAVVKILDQLGLLGPIVNAVMTAIGAVFSWLGDNIVPALQGAIQGLGDVFGAIAPLIQTVAGAVGSAFGAIATVVGTVISTIVSTISGAAGLISGAVGAIGVVIRAIATVFLVIGTVVATVVGGIIGWLADQLRPAVQGAGIVFNVVFGAISAVVTAVSNVIGGIINWIAKTIFPAASGAAKTMGSGIGTVFNVIGSVVKTVAGVVSTILGAIGSVVFPVLKGAADALGRGIGIAFGVITTIVQGALTIIKPITDAIGAAFQAMGAVISGVWDGVTGVIKGAINFVISLVNKFIGFLDGMQISVPTIDLGPLGKIGGFTIGLPYISPIPYLAAGGIVDRPTLAMIGEGNKREAVVPLDSPAGRNLLGGGGQPIQVGPIYLQGVGEDVSPSRAAAFGRQVADAAAVAFRDQTARTVGSRTIP